METNDIFDHCTGLLADDQYAVVDQFVTDDQVREMLSELQKRYAQGEFSQAGIGKSPRREQDRSVRGDLIHWLDPGDARGALAAFIHRVREFMAYLNRSCFLGLKDFEMHFAVYPPGTFYKRHLDQFRQDDTRVLTFICYLNFDWKPHDGGTLRLYLPKGQQGEVCVDIAPLAGRFVCFRSQSLEHEVLPTARTRFSLTGWLLNRKGDLKFLP